MCRDVGRHALEERVAGSTLESAAALCRCEQNLDIHLDVGRVDARRVVDEVGVEPSARLRELHSTTLRAAQIAAFADDFGPHLSAVRADRIVRAIAHFGVALGGCFHVRSDTAIPQQVHRHTQNGSQHLRGCRGARRDA